MILIDMKQQNSSENYLELDEFEDQIHESGFIDIPLQSMIQENQHNQGLRPGKLKRRIQRFKNKNRFYR
jgi:hypothetical protein